MRFILIWFSFITLTFEAGVSMHLYLVSRVSDMSLPLNYLLSGSFYPDSFYNCLGLSDIGEYDHWSPFLYELVKYYNTLPDEDLKFKLFIYGILNHQITDITWHSIRLNEGLLKFLKNVEFYQDKEYTNAHNFLDTGADFILLDRLLQNFEADPILEFFKTPWEIPIRHLINVYHKLGYYQINEQNLKYCMLRGHTALQLELESVLHSSPANYYRQNSPLFVDILDEYYLGGLQEIINTLDQCLPNLEYWFHNIDKIKDSRSICQTFIGTGSSSEIISEMGSDITYLSTYIPNSYFGTSIVSGKFLNGANCIAVSAPFEDEKGSIYIIPIDEITLSRQHLQIKSNVAKMKYATRFGWKMLTFMDQFLVVSSPGSSMLQIYYENRVILEIVDLESDNTIGEHGLKQLGILLEKDGDDIVVGSKYADYNEVEEQKGVVFILDGDSILFEILQNFETTTPVVFNINYFIKRKLKLPLYLNQVSNFENFGSQFTSLDNLQLISVENLGVIVIYQDYEPKFIIKHDLSIIMYKPDNKITKIKSSISQQFGANFIKIVEIDKIRYLITSAKSIGCGFIFQILSGEIELIAKISISNGNSFDQFFTNAILVNSNLIVSSPNFQNRGAIWVINIPKIISQFKGDIVHYLLDDDLIITGVENIGYSSFGTSLVFTNGKLIVGMPKFGYNELYNDAYKLIGKVGVYSNPF